MNLLLKMVYYLLVQKKRTRKNYKKEQLLKKKENKNGMNLTKYSEFLDIGKKTTKLERVLFEEWEIKKIWENKDHIEFMDTILILIYTGMRVSELLI